MVTSCQHDLRSEDPGALQRDSASLTSMDHLSTETSLPRLRKEETCKRTGHLLGELQRISPACPHQGKFLLLPGGDGALKGRQQKAAPLLVVQLWFELLLS